MSNNLSSTPSNNTNGVGGREFSPDIRDEVDNITKPLGTLKLLLADALKKSEYSEDPILLAIQAFVNNESDNQSDGYHYGNLGTVYAIQGKYEDAKSVYKNALDILSRQDSSFLDCVTLKVNIARLSQVEGNYNDAFAKYEEVLEQVFGSLNGWKFVPDLNVIALLINVYGTIQDILDYPQLSVGHDNFSTAQLSHPEQYQENANQQRENISLVARYIDFLETTFINPLIKRGLITKEALTCYNGDFLSLPHTPVDLPSLMVDAQPSLKKIAPITESSE